MLFLRLFLVLMKNDLRYHYPFKTWPFNLIRVNPQSKFVVDENCFLLRVFWRKDLKEKCFHKITLDLKTSIDKLFVLFGNGGVLIWGTKRWCTRKDGWKERKRLLVRVTRILLEEGGESDECAWVLEAKTPNDRLQTFANPTEEVFATSKHSFEVFCGPFAENS